MTIHDTLEDIEVLENVLIAFNEGASDERRMAMDSLYALVDKKRSEVERFDQDMDALRIALGD